MKPEDLNLEELSLTTTTLDELDMEGPDWIQAGGALVPWDLRGVGIDPGRNFGMAWLQPGLLSLVWGQMPKEEDYTNYGLRAYELARFIFDEFDGSAAVVEGAAFNRGHGQVLLEAVRFGFVLGLKHGGWDKVAVVPPATIRAQALGHGHKKAKEIWPDMDHNAAAAVGAALYAAGVRRDEDTDS